MKATTIAVVGSKKSGKTTVIEALTRELTKRGYRIAVVKHIPEPDFTIDTKGKDTWRFAQAGAKTIIAASADEIATIEKMRLRNLSLELILQKCEGSNVVFLEGFKDLVNRNRDIPKIVVVRSAEEVYEAVANFEPILAFTGPYSVALDLSIPYVDIVKNSEKMADLVQEILSRKGS